MINDNIFKTFFIFFIFLFFMDLISNCPKKIKNCVCFQLVGFFWTVKNSGQGTSPNVALGMFAYRLHARGGDHG